MIGQLIKCNFKPIKQREMNIAEQNKHEADNVLLKYYFIEDDIDMLNCAIQDRQSVLYMLNKINDKTAEPNVVDEAIELEITNLTEQINYLKSKL